MGTSGLAYEQLRSESSARLTLEAIKTLDRGYLGEGETPNRMNHRLAARAADYYPNGYRNYSPKFLYDRFLQALNNGWFSPASPVASNFGAREGLPVSCYGILVQNSIDGIFKAAHEAAMLTKNGGGLGIDISELIGPSKVTSWARLYDLVMGICSQTGVRRGNVAIYCDLDHPDIELFLDSKDLLKGDIHTKLKCNIAVKISDNFFKKLLRKDKRAVRIFSKVLELRMKFGSPYIFFSDNVLLRDPEWYKALGLSTKHSQLCAEIFLHSDANTSYSCVLSSMNLYYFNEWCDLEDISLPELCTIFLDAVNQEFINKAKASKNPEGLMKAVRGAELGRPLGLGVYGFHAWLMKKRIPFESDAARIENLNIFQYIREQAEFATKQLAFEKGEPKWCEGFGRRNTHLLAIAPTTTSSILGNGITPGIQPIMGHMFSKSGAKGTFTRKNPILVEVLERYGKNTDVIWKSIRKKFGSVQHLDFLSDYEKLVFKTFPEIDPMWILRLAADRQQYIDQGQSLNLFIPPTAPAQKIVDYHLAAWRFGLKSLYYVYSESPMAQETDYDSMTVFLRTRDNCGYCKKAKALLDKMGIRYYTEDKFTGKVPEVWINGEMLEDGYSSLVDFLEGTEQAELPVDENSCTACEG